MAEARLSHAGVQSVCTVLLRSAEVVEATGRDCFQHCAVHRLGGSANKAHPGKGMAAHHAAGDDQVPEVAHAAA